jgi:hypothetical protein
MRNKTIIGEGRLRKTCRQYMVQEKDMHKANLMVVNHPLNHNNPTTSTINETNTISETNMITNPPTPRLHNPIAPHLHLHNITIQARHLMTILRLLQFNNSDHTRQGIHSKNPQLMNHPNHQ